ncbi:DUF3012 domain-containing protein [Methanococcus vannielii]|jgi:hypothetical protein|nr:DUF3012 domain-containing protein [Methanococcus vannielii]
MDILKNALFEEISSPNISISSAISKYILKLRDYEKNEWNLNDPYEYAKFCIHTMFIIRMIEKEINVSNLTKKEKETLEIVKKYKFRELVEPYEKNYVRFSVWKNREGTLLYKLSDYRQKLPEENSWEQVYSYFVIHPKKFPEIKSIVLKTVKEKNLIL